MDGAPAPRQRIFPRHPAPARYIAGVRTFLSIALALSFLTTLNSNALAQERRANALTADDLAVALGVHWWIVKIPSDLSPNVEIRVEVDSADGKMLEGGPGFSAPNLGKEARIYCYEIPGSNQMKVLITTERGESSVLLNNYFKGSGYTGAANGAVLSSDDVLLKFDKTKGAHFTGGNELTPGQIGLKVHITRRP